jgi:hypothetical protein
VPDVKRIFVRLLPCDESPICLPDAAEEKRIKIIIRTMAIILAVEALISCIFSEWYRKNGLPPGGRVALILELLAAYGLFFFKKGIGRIYTIILSFLIILGAAASDFGGKIFGYGYLYTTAVSIFFLTILIILLLPKTKFVFCEKKSVKKEECYRVREGQVE